jgi:hypothetical protein
MISDLQHVEPQLADEHRFRVLVSKQRQQVTSLSNAPFVLDISFPRLEGLLQFCFVMAMADDREPEPFHFALPH